MRTLTGRVAVITGAASGIGLALAQRCAADGMRVVLADVEEAALRRAVAGIPGALGVRCDVSSLDDVRQLADRTLSEFGAVHLVCNNAGVEGGAPFTEVAEQVWDWVLGVDLHGLINGCRVFLPLLRQQDEAHLVNTASIAALNCWMLTGTPYVTAKAAALGLTEYLHHEALATGDHVGISVLCPGFVTTNMPFSERNRPADVPSSDWSPARREINQAVVASAELEGLAPEVVAGQVLDAVRQRRFWVLPHRQEALDAVRARLAWMTGGPPPGPPPGTAASVAAFASVDA